MTFTPTPKDQLQPLNDLYGGWDDFAQQLLSRLYHAEQAANWAAAQITALYAALPDVLDEVWTYVGDNVSVVGPGEVAVHVNPDQSRSWALSKENIGGEWLDLDDLEQGSVIVLTDDPTSPPVTAFRQYTVTSDPTDRGDWISFDSVRIATFGTLTTPTVGATVRMVLR